MKKIVAVVLALVMVLGLATTAFADTTSSTVKAEGYSLLDMANEETAITGETFAKVVTDKVVTTVGDKTTTTYFADKYVIDETPYYACDATIAEYKLVKANKVVAYLTTAEAVGEGMTKTATAFVKGAGEDKAKCGEYEENTFVVGGKNYLVGETEYVLYKGLAVGIGDVATAEEHVFDKDNKTTDTKGKVVALTCDVCKASFKVVDKIPADYTGVVEAYGTQYVLMGSYTAADEAEKVESAKTFDAGIAMYVGMSVMAAAGSAVVLKKKD